MRSVKILALAFAALPALACAQSLPKPDRGGVPDSELYDYGVMGPPATPAIVEAARAAVALPPVKGPFAPTWESIAKHYQTPAWFGDAKFGIFMHWGVYSAAAHHNEWYEKHMYAADRAWHAQNFGPQERVGYKDLIPLFTAARWNPDDWAALFKAAGARFVMPTAQHHDNFALWDSKVTPFNAKRMGPKRDLIGDLAAAVRRKGMKFGVSNHGVENFTFINPVPELNDRLKAAKADLYDPAWGSFYNVADRSPAAMTRFLTDWVDRNVELIDKYKPDILWFDNGANLRVLDPLKTQVAAYYYNRARQWGKPVSISTKFVAYAPSNDDKKQIGSIVDFEKVGKRSPPDIRPGPWMVDDTIGSTWGYTEGMSVAGPGAILARLIDTVAKNGTYLLNIAPKADGTIPENQRDTLLGIGRWLQANGEAIYGTRPWMKFGEGGADGVRFTRRGRSVYAIALSWPGRELAISSLGSQAGRITRVELLGQRQPLRFTQDAGGLRIVLPAQKPAGLDHAYSFRITGL
ncbi:alpha-L-fucosidase [Sphingomonas sp.]|jgi:alpha-L-fucosidase|uniref:alpha-L-fucosidase n=1 Tax=Sphingomonas sp. TaxID=28214 RepID=UPI002ED9E3A4